MCRMFRGPARLSLRPAVAMIRGLAMAMHRVPLAGRVRRRFTAHLLRSQRVPFRGTRIQTACPAAAMAAFAVW